MATDHLFYLGRLVIQLTGVSALLVYSCNCHYIQWYTLFSRVLKNWPFFNQKTFGERSLYVRLSKSKVNMELILQTYSALIFNMYYSLTLLHCQAFHGSDFEGTSVGDPNKLSSGFPSFSIDKDLDLGFLAYGGYMIGNVHRKIGRYLTYNVLL